MTSISKRFTVHSGSLESCQAFIRANRFAGDIHNARIVERHGHWMVDADMDVVVRRDLQDEMRIGKQVTIDELIDEDKK